MEINDLKGKLQSSEAVVANLKRTLQRKDSELETLRTKVKDDATHNRNNDTLSYMMNSPIIGS